MSNFVLSASVCTKEPQQRISEAKLGLLWPWLLALAQTPQPTSVQQCIMLG